MLASELTPLPPRVVTNEVMATFFRRVLQESKPISSLTIVSPWISEWESRGVSLDSLLALINRACIRTLVLTRPPAEDWHKVALARLSSSRFVQIYLLPDLHAKLLLCEAIPVGFGLVGSANVTSKSLSNYEIGVLFEGRGFMSSLLKSLKTLAWSDLRARSSGRYS